MTSPQPTITAEPALDARDICKVYRLYDRPVDRLKEALDPFRRSFHRNFSALTNASLRVHRGETVGIVGRNGSGKSTLLKIISRVVAPSSGNLTVNGRVSALLELGTGFNPELTGIENVYYNGTLLGYHREQIDAKLPEITQFADIGEFVKQPIKSYSSGMLSRLGFAVAVAFDPEILIVDEALAVGDEAFQRKCFARIKAIQELGAAVLFVSHSAALVIELCERALLMDRGEVLMEGRPKAVVTQYHRLMFAPPERAAAIRDEIRNGETLSSPAPIPIAKPSHRSAPDEPPSEHDEAFFDPDLASRTVVEYPRRGAQIHDPHVETPAGRRVNVLQRNREYVFAYDVDFQEAKFHVVFGMLLKTVVGYELGGCSTRAANGPIDFAPAGTRANVRIRFRTLLSHGVYFLNAGVIGAEGGQEVYLHRIVDACMIRVQPQAGVASNGVVDFLMKPSVSIEPPLTPHTLPAENQERAA